MRQSGLQFFSGDTAPAARRARGHTRYPFWWPYPTLNTLDRATALFSRLLSERLDQFGIDFTVLYRSHGLYCPHIAGEQARRGMCRALNAELNRAASDPAIKERFDKAGLIDAVKASVKQ